MSTLIPEQRPDKNGKIVTRHVKPNAGTGLSGMGIPAPSIAMKEESPSETIERILTDSGRYSTMQIEDYSLTYLDGKGEKTQRVVADALLNCESDREMDAITKCITIIMEPGVLQLAASDIKFVLDVADTFPRDNPVQSLRVATDAMEDTFTSVFRPKGRASDHNKVDYLKYADAFKATMLSRVLMVDDDASSTFEAREQVDFIQGNMDSFRDNLPLLREASDAIVQTGVKTNPYELLKMVDYLEGNPSGIEAMATVALERRRFDADEIKLVLSSANAISQGAL